MLKVIEKIEETGEDSFEKRAFGILNHMAIEVDLKQKETFGDLGGITVGQCSNSK